MDKIAICIYCNQRNHKRCNHVKTQPGKSHVKFLLSSVASVSPATPTYPQKILPKTSPKTSHRSATSTFSHAQKTSQPTLANHKITISQIPISPILANCSSAPPPSPNSEHVFISFHKQPHNTNIPCPPPHLPLSSYIPPHRRRCLTLSQLAAPEHQCQTSLELRATGSQMPSITRLQTDFSKS